MLEHEGWRNYLGLQYDENKKNLLEYDKNNFFIVNFATLGNKNCELSLIINPQIDFKYLNIIEISYINKDNEKINLVKNKRIKNKERQFTRLTEIKFKNYDKYFKNMETGEEIKITISQKYQFDDGPIITEEAPYSLSCFEEKYNPLEWVPFPD